MNLAFKPNILILVGPTASGKTKAGISLSQALNGDIVSADARQVYRYMDIGTAKPTLAEQGMAKHFMIDVVNPDESYSAGRYAREASEIIFQILNRGRLPIIVGGSGFYLKALLDGFPLIPEIPQSIRKNLIRKAKYNLPSLYSHLQKIDPDIARQVHPNDKQRVVRGIEVFEATGTRLSTFQKQPRQHTKRWRTHWFGLNMDRMYLYERIKVRINLMLKNGLIGEIKNLRKKGYDCNLNSINSLGYKEIYKLIDGKIRIDEAVKNITCETRRYAKRQLTWFRREPQITWINPMKVDITDEIMNCVKVNE